MENITYQELADYIAKMPAERKLDNVSICVDSEFYPIKEIDVSKDSDILDDGHIILSVD